MHLVKNKLFVEKVDGIKIVKKFGTPTYCYSLNKLKKISGIFKIILKQ